MNKNIRTFTLSSISKTINALPHAFLISTIMSLGPLFQEKFIKIFTSEKVNLYDIATEGTILIHQSNFLEWVIALCKSWYIMPSLLIVILALRGYSFKKTLIFLTSLIFLFLMLSDIFFSEFKNTSDYISNIISNLIGSPIIAIFTILSLETGNIINKFFENQHIFITKLILFLTATSCSLLFIFLVYIMDKNIYSVTSSKIDLLTKLPIYNGAYAIEHNDKKTQTNEYKLFSSTLTDIQSISLMGVLKDSSFEWNNNSNTAYTAEIRILDDCSLQNEENKIIMQLLSNQPIYSAQSINQVKLMPNEGFAKIYILQKESNTGHLSISGKKDIQIELFSISESTKNHYNLVRYIEESMLINHSWENEISYALILPNLDLNSSNVESKIKSRETLLTIGDDSLKITLMPPTFNNADSKKYNCITLPKSIDGTYNLNSAFGGILLTLRKANNDDKSFSNSKEREETHIKGFSGQMTENNINQYELNKYISDNNISLLRLSAPIQELFIDGKEYKQSISSNDITVNKGTLTGRITEEGLLKFSGTANAIYIDRNRANLSRWEKVDIEYKIPLLSFLIGALLLIFKKLKQLLNENKRYSI